jgi:hypothetical protein
MLRLRFSRSGQSQSRLGPDSSFSPKPLACVTCWVASLFLLGNSSASANSPPLIITPPQSQVVCAGDSAIFQVEASGTEPLQFQWFKDGQSISGATQPIFQAGNVAFSDAGSYTVHVGNRFGTAEATGVLMVGPIVRLLTTTAQPGVVDVPLELTAGGRENALGFSLAFDPGVLSFVSAVPRNDAQGAALIVNDSQGAAGQIGIALALPANQVFTNGVRTVLTLRFGVGQAPLSALTVLQMQGKPVPMQVSDAQANLLDALFESGSVLLISGIEGDVNGDSAVTATDVTKIGRMVAGLDVELDAGILQRADCAPLSTGGDGFLGIDDWVQAARFASGLDPKQPAAGPVPVAVSNATHGTTGPNVALLTDSPITQVRIVNSTLLGEAPAVSIELQATGKESAVGFTLNFDPSQLLVEGVTSGTVPASSLVMVNSDQSSGGKIGVLVALPAGMTFQPGTTELVTLQVAPTVQGTSGGAFGFGSQIVAEEVSDAYGGKLDVDFVSNVVSWAAVASRVRSVRVLSGGQIQITFAPGNASGSSTGQPPVDHVFACDRLSTLRSDWQPVLFTKVGETTLLISDPKSGASPRRFYILSAGE